MNVRDPFGIRSPAITLLRHTTRQAAATIQQKVLDSVESTAQAIESGKQAVEEMSSYGIPSNGSSFNSAHRDHDDTAWSSSGVTSRSARQNGLGEKIGSYFESSGRRDLPMYKDKPFTYPASRRYRPIWKKRKVYALIGLAIMGVLYMFGIIGGDNPEEDREERGWSWLTTEKSTSKVDWLKRREHVVEAFTLSWDAYERYAWGYDEFHPVSKTGKQMTPNGLGWIIVDSLDTLMLMNLTSRLSNARQWITTKLDYDQDQEVNTFETTIRMLGGLLSAHYLSTTFPDLAPIAEDDPGKAGEDLYIEKAKDLADRIMGAFETKSGVPYASFNLKTTQGIPSHADGGASSTAEAATLQLEFKYLSKLTGEKEYWDRAERVLEVIDSNGMEGGLLPIYIYAETGLFRGNNIRLGSRGDSYYEYLIKQYLQTNEKEPVYSEMWHEALAGIRKHLITYSNPSQFTVLGERPSGLHESLSPKMDHLVCFMPGTIALAATGGLSIAEAKKLSEWGIQNQKDLDLAAELMQTCWGMYKATATGLAGEITHFNIDVPPKNVGAPHKAPATFDEEEEGKGAWREDFIVKPGDHHNLQRPETVESLFYMWRITGEEKYREWGWEMFRSFMNYTAVEHGGGFTSLSNADVLPPVLADNMESFWLAETLKYFYLLFSPSTLLPLDKVVINTEAHPFPRFDPSPLFWTGWKRKPRDADGKILDSAASNVDHPAKESNPTGHHEQGREHDVGTAAGMVEDAMRGGAKEKVLVGDNDENGKAESKGKKTRTVKIMDKSKGEMVDMEIPDDAL